jgi:hypothetical protein
MPHLGVDKDGRWFGWDDLVAAGVSFVVGYVSHGITTGDWGSNAVKAGSISAIADWVAWNTGGSSIASGGMSFWGTVGTGATSGAASGVVSEGLTYISETSNFEFKDFIKNSVNGAITGAITGAVFSAAVYSLEYIGTETKFLIEERKITNSGDYFTVQKNVDDLKALGINVRTKQTTFFSGLASLTEYYYTYKDVIYSPLGKVFRHFATEATNEFSRNEKLRKKIYKMFEKKWEKIKKDGVEIDIWEHSFTKKNKEEKLQKNKYYIYDFVPLK